ncbi:MAG TPA: hypothetical protein VGD67_14855, partial [Pseudonocardiaceae bacterium]
MLVTASTVLRVLARLTPTGRTGEDVVDLRATASGAVWLGHDSLWSAASARRGQEPAASPGQDFTALPGPLRLRNTRAVARLAAIDELYRDDRRLRAGWTVLTGQAGSGPDATRVCTPLVSWPVRLRTVPGGGVELEVAGDLETTRLVADRERADALAEGVRFGGGELADDSEMTTLPVLSAWIREVAAAAGHPEVTVEPPGVNPLTRRTPGLAAVAGLVLYVGRVPNPVSAQETLRAWSRREDLDRTALAALYTTPEHADTVPEHATAVRAPEAGSPPPDAAADVVGPLPLSAAQRGVVLAARTAPVTAVSGPPGCGKTHTLVALALDAVARGDSVLLATRSRHAAEVIGDMLRRAD